MAISKVERLMNLVIALLSTDQFLPADKIRTSVGGYDGSTGAEAFFRMFERDKNELRELGIPLEVGYSRRYGVEGYRINRDAYELPEIDLTSEEAAAVAVAGQLWGSPELAGAAHSALVKLRAAGIRVDRELPVVVSATGSRSRGGEPVIGALVAAIEAGRAVRFDHRSVAAAATTRREVEPWGVVTYRARWYLVGHDRDRDATRTFRLSRIGPPVEAIGPAGAVRPPEALNPRTIVEQFRAGMSVTGVADVWVADDHGHDLRRIGESEGPMRLAGRAGTRLRVPVRTHDWLVRLIAGHGPDAVVLEPARLRETVLRRLRSVAEPEVVVADR